MNGDWLSLLEQGIILNMKSPDAAGTQDVTDPGYLKMV